MLRLHKLPLLAALLAASAICHAGFVDNKPISIGKAVSGELQKGDEGDLFKDRDGEGSYIDTYVFRGRTGQKVTVTLETSGSNGAIPSFNLWHPNDGSHKNKKDMTSDEYLLARGRDNPLLTRARFGDNHNNPVTDARSGFLQKTIELKTNGEYRLDVMSDLHRENAMTFYPIPSSYRLVVEDADSATLVAPPKAEAVARMIQRYFNRESEFAGTHAMEKIMGDSIYLTARDKADANIDFCAKPISAGKGERSDEQCVKYRFPLQKKSGGDWQVTGMVPTYLAEKQAKAEEEKLQKAKVPDFTLRAEGKSSAWTETFKDQTATLQIDLDSTQAVKGFKAARFMIENTRPVRLRDSSETVSSIKGIAVAKCDDKEISLTNAVAYASLQGKGKKVMTDPGPWIFAAPDGPREKAMFRVLCK